MQSISPRDAFLLGGLGLAGTVAGGAGLWVALALPPHTGTAAGPGEELLQPPELRSAGGKLQLRLEAGPGQFRLGGRQASAYGYNGSLPGPTLRLRAGDELSIRFVNSLDEDTNLHLHGLHVSPAGSADNVFVTVSPGASFDYNYRLPPDHPPGMYWYHPHHHGLVARQIFGGLFGAIIVEDPEPIESATERVLVVSDTSLDGGGNVRGVTPMERVAGRE